MPKIFELFGYPLYDRGQEATESRSRAHCPFINGQCDGGGNRYSSQVDLSVKHPLTTIFTGLTAIPAGVCSIQTNIDSQPWIVCPRRLLALGRENPGGLNEQAKRNIDRFPADFMFQAKIQEVIALRLQFATSKGGRRYSPYVFTEHGAVMAANVLNSPFAIKASKKKTFNRSHHGSNVFVLPIDFRGPYKGYTSKLAQFTSTAPESLCH